VCFIVGGVSYILLTDPIAFSGIDSAFELDLWRIVGSFFSMFSVLLAFFVFYRNTNRFSKEIFSYLKDNLSVRYTWKDKPLPEMELKFEKDIIDEEQLKNRVKLDLTGTDLWFSSIEANIAFKETLLKSEKDQEDANHLRTVYSDLISEEKPQVFTESRFHPHFWSPIITGHFNWNSLDFPILFIHLNVAGFLVAPHAREYCCKTIIINRNSIRISKKDQIGYS